MGELLELLDGIVNITDLYDKYRIKGCVLIVLAFLVVLGFIIVLASFMQ